jgi:peptide/nickel transport system permease protein
MTSRCTGTTPQGSEKLTETIFWERSVSLFALRFGRADSESAGDIGTEVARRMWVSLQLALPMFVLQIFASVSFALLLVTFRPRASTSGAWCCAW